MGSCLIFFVLDEEGGRGERVTPDSVLVYSTSMKLPFELNAVLALCPFFHKWIQLMGGSVFKKVVP